MQISFTIPAYNSTYRLEQLLDSIFLHEQTSHDEVIVDLFLHSSYSPTVEICDRVGKRANVEYYRYMENRGLARTWNDGTLTAYNDRKSDLVIIVNDDVWFEEGDIAKIADVAKKNPHRYMIAPAGYHHKHRKRLPSLGYSAFALNKITLETIGCFDENLFPAYLEDADHSYRAALTVKDPSLHTLKEILVENTNVQHDGSGAIFRDIRLARQNVVNHQKNFRYYIRKWGGINGSEIYRKPFNDSRFTLYIDPKVRHMPYPDHNRVELEEAFQA